MSDEKRSSGLGRAYSQVGPYLSIGVEFTAAILLCLGVGWWIDGRFHTTPAFTLVGAFFGMAAGFYNLYRTVMGIQKRNRKGHGPGGEA
ncbi:MAG: AtpZ/AtpI family protein [Candidatus Latescibacteria bacterium]|nr:AtpZ/AtpI family protein [Candidatus Latescibacterota bacterium]